MHPTEPSGQQSAGSAATRVDLMAAGVPVTVEVEGCNTHLAAAQIRRVWARCLRDDAAEPAAVVRVLLDDDPGVVAAARASGAIAGTELVPVMHDLSPRVTEAALSTLAASPVLLFHAGGLCAPDGATVMLVGPSGAGKTTAVRTLAASLGYVSDETIAVAADGTIAPYPKPFSVLDRGDAWKTQHAPEAIGAGPTPARARLAGVLVLARDPAAPTVPQVEELGVLEAISALAPQVAYLAGHPRPLARMAALIEAVGPVLRVRYAESAHLAPLVESLLAAPKRAVRRLPDLRAEEAPRRSEPGPGEVALAPHHDLVMLPDGSAGLLLGETFLGLSPGAGGVVAELSAGPLAREHLLAGAADRGPLLEALVEAGVVRTASA